MSLPGPVRIRAIVSAGHHRAHMLRLHEGHVRQAVLQLRSWVDSYVDGNSRNYDLEGTVEQLFEECGYVGTFQYLGQLTRVTHDVDRITAVSTINDVMALHRIPR